MALRTLWQCDRDGKMFTTKKEADAYDKMLDLADAVTDLLNNRLTGLDEQHSEQIGRLLAEQKEEFGKAFRGNLTALTDLHLAEQSEDTATPEDFDASNNVTKLAV